VKPQVSEHFGEYCQVMESGVTEPGLQADLPASWPPSDPPCSVSVPAVALLTEITKFAAEPALSIYGDLGVSRCYRWPPRFVPFSYCTVWLPAAGSMQIRGTSVTVES
jgi:hypothetical protein